MTKVVYTFRGENCYIPPLDTIWLDSRLKKYPKLHRLVLEHEMYHAKHNNLMEDIRNDMKDIFLPLTYDFYKYFTDDRKNKEYEKERRRVEKYRLFDFFRRIFQTIAFSILFPFHEYRLRKERRLKRKK